MASDLTPELTSLGRRAVECRGWRWLRGMSTIGELGGSTVYWEHPNPVVVHSGGNRYEIPLQSIPDLSDPATLGCLLALVREAWRDPYLQSPEVDFDQDGVVAWDPGVGLREFLAHSEAEALIIALERAPEKP